MKISTLIAFACLTALVVGSAIILTDNIGWPGLVLVGLVVWVGTLVAKWYFADAQPVFAVATPGRVHFKDVVQRELRELHDVFGIGKLAGWARRVWIFWGPRVTNTVLIALLALDAYVFQEPTLKAAIEQTQYGWALLLALHLFATVAPRGAPDRIPAPGQA